MTCAYYIRCRLPSCVLAAAASQLATETMYEGNAVIDFTMPVRVQLECCSRLATAEVS